MPTFKLLPVEVPARSAKSIYALEIDGTSPYEDFIGKMKKAGKKADLSKLGILLDQLALVGQTVSFVALSRSYCGSWQGAKTGVQP
jgi:hypothetical protein